MTVHELGKAIGDIAYAQSKSGQAAYQAGRKDLARELRCVLRPFETAEIDTWEEATMVVEALTGALIEIQRRLSLEVNE